MNARLIVAAAAFAAFSAPALACYTVYDSGNTVVYEAQEPPVNMSYNIGDTLPRVYPGAHMVFDLRNDCPINNAVRSIPMSGTMRPNTMSTSRQPPSVAPDRTAALPVMR